MLLGCAASATSAAASAAEPTAPLQARRILFLGDSITHSGGYVAFVETQLRLHKVQPLPEIINVGLSSETCSGLSEPGHPFPRPNVHERLDRALSRLQPDLVVACYGMNDGIYHPFSEERFAAYRRGIETLIEKAETAGARVVLLTPPPFDPLPLRDKGKLLPADSNAFGFTGMYADYDDVLARYSNWLLSLSDRVLMVVDLHAAMLQELQQRRAAQPDFTFSPDGIHPNAAGHELLGAAICRAWRLTPVTPSDPELRQLVARRMALVHDSWLTEIGHQRPGVKAGLPLPELQELLTDLDERIKQRLTAIADDVAK